MTTADLLPLLAWLSPSFPVGAFAYSHGLETAVEAGDVRDAATLRAWIDDLTRAGSIRADMVLVACAARAFGAGDRDAFARVSDLALALCPSRERRLESAQQGGSFVAALRAAWPAPRLDDAHLAGEIAYPVAFGAAVAAHGLAPRPALAAYGLQFASNLVSAVVRLGTIGQTEGQRLVAGLAGAMTRLAGVAARATLDDLGSAVFRSDIAAMRHETKYSRVFRS